MVASDQIVHADELGNQHDFTSGLWRIKTGNGLSTLPDGTIVATAANPTLSVTTAPLYEYRDLWAEESATLQSGATEWSFGNGAIGRIGVPVGSGWEVVEMGFHAEAAGVSISVNLVDFQAPGDPVIATIAVTGGFGVDEFATPVAVPAGAVLGFRTGTEVGSYSDGRVSARLRRQIGEYVTGVTIV